MEENSSTNSQNKLSGKTEYSGRRRNTRQRSGYTSHPDSVGKEYTKSLADVFRISSAKPLIVSFQFPENKTNVFTGFGMYFYCDTSVNITIKNDNSDENLKEHFDTPSFSKLGSIWRNTKISSEVVVTFSSAKDTEISIYEIDCGLIWHDYFDETIKDGQEKSHLTKNFSIMPECGFGNYIKKGHFSINTEALTDKKTTIHLKSCNRCARFLPINIVNQKNILSFSNHCSDARAPCTHTGFGKLTNIETNEFFWLHHGFQLECRFCKKFVVNRALNKKRSTAQMKEDGQRRRHFELLIAELQQRSEQLNFRAKTKMELSDYIWDNFKGSCFKCSNKIESKRKMQIDHTRPLALLWPLDETATVLCASCNNQKRDQSPSEFYSNTEIAKLSSLTGLSLDELRSTEPNHKIINELINRKDWFFNEFLNKPELLKEKEGKIAAELIVKALDKVLSRSETVEYNFSFVDQYKGRQWRDKVNHFSSL
mgnify:CR=1 FL=1